MKRSYRHLFAALAVTLCMAVAAHAGDNPPPKYPSLPSETPAHFVPDHHGRRLSVEHLYRSKRDAVMPSHLQRYFADLRAIRHDLSYSAWVGVPEKPSVLIGKLLRRLEVYSR